MHCTVGPALFVEVFGAQNFTADALKVKVRQLVDADIPVRRRRVQTADAIARYQAGGQSDKARLLSWRAETYFDEYHYADFSDYYYGDRECYCDRSTTRTD